LIFTAWMTPESWPTSWLNQLIADIVKDVLPDGYITIEFKPTANDPEERQISISYPETSREIITAMEAEWPEVKP
jgi:hypothetical protein